MRLSLFLVCLFMPISTLALSEDGISTGLHLLQPGEISVDVYKYLENRDPYLAPLDQRLTQGANFNLNVDLAEYSGYRFYMQNVLHFDQEGDRGPVKHAGWQYETGAILWRSGGQDKLAGFLQHHSQHVLDEERPGEHFPVYTRYGLRFIFFSK